VLRKVLLLITSGYVLAILLVFALGLMAISGMNALHSISHSLYEHPFRVNAAALDASRSVALIRERILLISLSENPQQTAKLASEIPPLEKEVGAQLDIIKANFLGDMRRVTDAEELLQEWQGLRKREIDLSLHGQAGEADRLMRNSGAELFTRLNEELNYVTDFSRQRASAFIEESEAEMRTQTTRIGWLVAVLIAIIGLVGWVVARRVLIEVHHGEQLEKSLLEKAHQAETAMYTRSLIEASLDPLVTISAEGKITDVNKAGEVVSGKSRSELVGTDFADYFTEPDKARAGYRKVFTEGFVTDYPLAILHRDGHVTDVLYNASVYRNEAGEVLGVFAAARDVTERKHAEFVLRQSEEALKEAQRMAHVGSWYLDLATNRVVWSEVLYQMYGFDPALPPPLYTESVKLFTPESWEKLSAAIARATETGIPYELELEMVPKDGGRKWMLARGELVRDERGAPARVRGVVMDITERKLAENAIKEKEERLALATINNGVGIWDWNLQTQQMIWDDSMFALYHIRREDFIGTEEAWRASLHPDDLARGDQEVADAISGKQPFETEFRVVWPNGEIRHIKAVAKVFRDDQGTPLRMLGINMDVTDRNKAEMKLRESEDKFKYVFDHSPIGKTLTLPSGELQVNQAFCEMLGYSDEELGHSRWQDITHPDDIELTQRTIDQLLSGEQDSAHFVKRYLHKNGSVVWIDMVTSLRRDEKGQPLYFMTSVIDITERKRAEEELRKYHEHLEELVQERTAKLEAANRELESFSYSVSHDLRSPLRAIDGFSRILLDDYAGRLDDEGKRLLNVVRDNTSRMGQLIDDILKFSRTSSLEMTFSGIDMEGLAREVVDELRPSVDHSKLQLEIEAIPPATGDRAMMHQVFVNLLSNAIKFSRYKEPAMIKVGGSLDGSEAIYFVRDNGAGFDMRYAEKLFGVFQRLHGVNEFEGTGIGLAIVKRIVNRHGGRVWAEGKVNEGATIYFSIPAPVLTPEVH